MRKQEKVPESPPLFSDTAEFTRVDQTQPDSFCRHQIAEFRPAPPEPWAVWHVWHTTARELADRIYHQATAGEAPG